MYIIGHRFLLWEHAQSICHSQYHINETGHRLRSPARSTTQVATLSNHSIYNCCTSLSPDTHCKFRQESFRKVNFSPYPNQRSAQMTTVDQSVLHGTGDLHNRSSVHTSSTSIHIPGTSTVPVESHKAMHAWRVLSEVGAARMACRFAAGTQKCQAGLCLPS